jgi:hypothetical protein
MGWGQTSTGIALMVARRSFSPALLTGLRQMPAGDALPLLAIEVKADPTYRPIKTGRSRRWHVRSAHGQFEILTTGPKWYDTRARRGGGGAVDLAMHILGLSFVDAVKYLRGAAGPNGPDRS